MKDNASCQRLCIPTATRPLIPKVRCPLWCQMEVVAPGVVAPGARGQMPGARGKGSNARCQVQGVRCQVQGVRCQGPWVPCARGHGCQVPGARGGPGDSRRGCKVAPLSMTAEIQAEAVLIGQLLLGTLSMADQIFLLMSSLGISGPNRTFFFYPSSQTCKK